MFVIVVAIAFDGEVGGQIRASMEIYGRLSSGV